MLDNTAIQPIENFYMKTLSKLKLDNLNKVELD
ncbi:hypothetical protein KL86DYS2_10396 [uncultured Dysgonomonas sp.]|uniref:Uncharacterized protein n=1 Tax=uncultured Dysgonomonas sp. TaxID=206096 RepID=A0A212IZI0_9BACT|nr:hypothetical protein KL86DYS2_10396 [uncultured Dysgonomonas sp.]